MNIPAWGDFNRWGLVIVVIRVALGYKFFTRGIASPAAILLGLVTGCRVGIATGAFNFSDLAIVDICLTSIVSAIETVSAISSIAKVVAGREATGKELAGGTDTDGIGSANTGVFGGLPNIMFRQNASLISMAGVKSRFVVPLSALFLIACGLIPRVGAMVANMPISVLGGGVLMFCLVLSQGVSMLSSVIWSRRDMMILATSMSFGLGLQRAKIIQHRPNLFEKLALSGLLPVAVLATGLNLILPEDSD